jgi:hypothetical protein
MSGDVEVIRTREVRGPGGRKARLKRAQESTSAKEPGIAKALLAANDSEEPVVEREKPVESAEREAVKVKVLRICANPRLVLCAYQDDGLERRVLVRVGRNRNFTPRMELKAIRPERETEPWLYQGRLPRLRGRW